MLINYENNLLLKSRFPLKSNVYFCKNEIMRRKIILNIYEAFADQLKVEHQKPLLDENLQFIITSLNKIDPIIEEIISAYEIDILSLSYMEKEMEMRIKFPEIWKMQLQEAKDSIASIKSQIIDLETKHKVNITEIFKNYENQKLSLDDFSKIV